MLVGEHLRTLSEQEGFTPTVQARLVTTEDGEQGYYITKDGGRTWHRVHRPTFKLCQRIEKAMRVNS